MNTEIDVSEPLEVYCRKTKEVWPAEFARQSDGRVYVTYNGYGEIYFEDGEYGGGSRPHVLRNVVPIKEKEDHEMILPDGFTIGADPEVFVTDETGKLVSAVGLIPGDKDNPYRVEGGAVQVDGLALEFNVDPCRTFEEFEERITGVMSQLKDMLPKGYDFQITPTAKFDQAYYDTLPEDAKVLGCNPDFNAWDGAKENPSPNGELAAKGLRTAAGHIHIGWGSDIPVDHPEHIQICTDVVKMLDWYLGLASRYLDPDVTRRQMYGMAGAFRPKSYGVEYRVPSNFWLTTKARRKFVFTCVQKVLEAMQAGNINCIHDNSAQTIINYAESGYTDIAKRFSKITIPKTLTDNYKAPTPRAKKAVATSTTPRDWVN